MDRFRIYRHVMRCLATASGIFACTGLVSAGPKIVLGRAVTAQRQISMDNVEHQLWDTLLQKYVDAQGRVNYRDWQASKRDRQTLARYLEHLSFASRTIPAARESELAFWINAYNAVTIEGILRVYPTTSIRNHTPRFAGYNIWKDLLLNVGDSRVSLDDMEHKILRTMGEPRIHFAIVCGSRSCPRLMNRAYTADKLMTQLTQNATLFFADAANFRHDEPRNRFYLSAILDWFAADFGAEESALLTRIAPYLPTVSARQAAKNNSARLSYLKYDWSLNEQPASKRLEKNK